MCPHTVGVTAGKAAAAAAAHGAPIASRAAVKGKVVEGHQKSLFDYNLDPSADPGEDVWPYKAGESITAATMLTYAHLCSPMLTYAHLCSPMLTYYKKKNALCRRGYGQPMQCPWRLQSPRRGRGLAVAGNAD